MDYYVIGTTIMCIGSSVKVGMTTNTRYLLPKGWSSMENSSRIIGGVLILCIVLTAFFIVLLTTLPENIVEDEEVFFEDVEQGFYCGVSEKTELKIIDLETWEDLWAEMQSIRTPVPQTPIIDFSTNVVFAVFQGERTIGGYVTTITQIVLTATGCVVFIDEVHPGPDCGTIQSLTQPYHIVVVTSSSQNLPVQFVYNIIEGEEVFFEDVEQGFYCGVSERIELKITDLETWRDLWTEMESIYTPVDPAPIINFSTNVLFVVFQGERASGGYVTTITRIVLTATGYVVFIDEVHPGPDCIVTHALTQPYHIVVVTSSSQNLPVQFVYNITTYDWGP